MKHVFFHCHVSLDVWSHIMDWMGMGRRLSSLDRVLRWLKKVAKGSTWQCIVKHMALGSTVYYLWEACKRLVFEDSQPIVECIIRRIKTCVYKTIFTLYPYVLVQFESLAMGLM